MARSTIVKRSKIVPVSAQIEQEKAQPESNSVDNFINGETGQKSKKVREIKTQISFKILPSTLAEVDQVAAKNGVTRAAWINLAIRKALDGEH